MAPNAGPDPVRWPIAARLWRHRRALTLFVVLGATYRYVNHRLDANEVPNDIAASDPYDEPETQWSVVRDGLPADADGLYYVPGIGILPVARDARWTDGLRGSVEVLFQDRLNTWERRWVVIDLPGLPPIVTADDRTPAMHLDWMKQGADTIELSADPGSWVLRQDSWSDSSGPVRTLPAEADHIRVRYFHEGMGSRPWSMPIRSPERNNAVRAEPTRLVDAREGITVAIAAVAAWPGGTAVRLEGWTDDPDDVVLLGLDARPPWGNDRHNDSLAADPAGAVVLRDGLGRVYPLRNMGQLGDRRSLLGAWGRWLGFHALGEKPGIDLPATLLFDPLSADVTALSLHVGPLRVATDLLLPERADRPAEGEARTEVVIPVPKSAPAPSSVRVDSYTYDGYEMIVETSITLASATVTVRRAVMAVEDTVVLELANAPADATRHLVDVLPVLAGRRYPDGERFPRYGTSALGADGRWRPIVHVRVKDGPHWPTSRATAFAAVGSAARPGDVRWPPQGARALTVAFVRPIVEVSGAWTFDLPVDVLRANAAANAKVGGATDGSNAAP